MVDQISKDILPELLEWIYDHYDEMCAYIQAAGYARNEEYIEPEIDLYMTACFDCLEEIANYGVAFRQGVHDLDAIKIFSFAIPQLRHIYIERKVKSNSAIENSIPIWYEAIISVICHSENQRVSILKLRQRKLVTTCQILERMAYLEKSYSFAPYLYILGIQQSSAATL